MYQSVMQCDNHRGELGHKPKFCSVLFSSLIILILVVRPLLDSVGSGSDPEFAYSHYRIWLETISNLHLHFSSISQDLRCIFFLLVSI